MINKSVVRIFLDDFLYDRKQIWLYCVMGLLPSSIYANDNNEHKVKTPPPMDLWHRSAINLHIY